MKESFSKEKIDRFFLIELLHEYCGRFNYDCQNLHIIFDEEWVVILDEPNDDFARFFENVGLKVIA